MKLQKDGQMPLYQQLANALALEIKSGRRPDGSVLMAERKLAKQLGVHRNTVMKAYGLLKDWQLIEGRGGSGHYVTYAESSSFCSDDKRLVRRKRLVNWPALLESDEKAAISDLDRYYEHADKDVISLAIGGASPAVFGHEAEEMIASIACQLPLRNGCASYVGTEDLVRALVNNLKSQGVSCNRSNIQVLYEINQAMDFISAAFIDEGDVVMIEEPISPDVYRAFQSVGAKLVAAASDDEGISTEHLEQAILYYKPKVLVVSTGVKDPTGCCLSLKRRQILADLSYKYGIIIIEDNTGNDLIWKEAFPPLKALCPENVIYVKSFGLTFLPAMALAVVCAPKLLVEKLSSLVSQRILSVNWLSQQVLATALNQGFYDRCLEEQRSMNKRKFKLMLDFIEKDPVLNKALKPVKVDGGCYLWVVVNEEYLVKGGLSKVICDAKKQGLLVLDGRVFYFSTKHPRPALRLCFSIENEKTIEAGLTILSKVFDDNLHG